MGHEILLGRARYLVPARIGTLPSRVTRERSRADKGDEITAGQEAGRREQSTEPFYSFTDRGSQLDVAGTLTSRLFFSLRAEQNSFRDPTI